MLSSSMLRTPTEKIIADKESSSAKRIKRTFETTFSGKNKKVSQVYIDKGRVHHLGNTSTCYNWAASVHQSSFE